MSELNAYQQTNLARWDELAALHPGIETYGLEAFKAGRSKLRPLDLEEVGAVRGKTLLHLQCHFGLDTLSWAREGALVTGVDFAPRAIETARAIAAECGIDARFVCSTIDDLPANLAGRFDVVYTSRGVLGWLQDIRRWGQVVGHFLKPGGVFYVADNHPAFNMYEARAGSTDLQRLYSYFHRDEPYRFDAPGSYMDATAPVAHTTEFFWNHTLADIINALIAAGLRIEFLHEFPYTYHDFFPFMECDASGWWRRLPGDDERLPLMFSLRAIDGEQPAPE